MLKENWRSSVLIRKVDGMSALKLSMRSNQLSENQMIFEQDPTNAIKDDAHLSSFIRIANLPANL